jgi:hypothetical protein
MSGVLALTVDRILLILLISLMKSVNTKNSTQTNFPYL